MKYLCIGQCIYDITLLIDEELKENTKMTVSKKIECAGGSSCNCSFLLRNWGCDTSFAGTLGNDYYGNLIEKELNNYDINTKYLEKVNQFTSSSYIVSNIFNKTRSILSNKNTLNKNKNMLCDNYDIIILDGYEKKFSINAIKNNKSAIKILDAGKFKNEIIELGYLVDYFICSHDFIEEFCNRKIDYNNINSIIDVYKKLEKWFNNNIIITLEDKGCFAKIDGCYKLIPSIKVNAIDTCCAGDIFHGAFAYFISHNYSLEDTCYLSNITAALSTTKVGRVNSIFNYSDVLEVYNSVFKK